jgi:sugar lactone lactonase YvrE
VSRAKLITFLRNQRSVSVKKMPTILSKDFLKIQLTLGILILASSFSSCSSCRSKLETKVRSGGLKSYDCTVPENRDNPKRCQLSLEVSASTVDPIVKSGSVLTFDLTYNNLQTATIKEATLAYSADGIDFSDPVNVTIDAGKVSWTAPATSTSLSKIRIKVTATDGRTAIHETPSFMIATKMYSIAGKPDVFSYASAGSKQKASFYNPSAMASDGTYLYVADISVIWKVNIVSGETEILVGEIGSNSVFLDGSRYLARVGSIFGMAILGSRLYFTDYSYCAIRYVNLDTSSASYGTVITAVGSAGNCVNVDGPDTVARVNKPYGLTTNGTLLFFTDAGSYTVRQIDPATNHTVLTIAGTPNSRSSVVTPGTGASSFFSTPAGIAYSSFAGGVLFVSDTSTTVIRRIETGSPHNTSVFYGVASDTGLNDGNSATGRVGFMTQIAANATKLYLFSPQAETVRELDLATATVSTVSGKLGEAGFADGNGLTTARYGGIQCGALDGNNLFLGDKYNTSIRIHNTTTNVVSTLAGPTSDTVLMQSATTVLQSGTFGLSRGITTADGNIYYFSDYQNHIVRQFNLSTGSITTVAGSPGVFGTTNGTGTAASFNRPEDLVIIGNTLYIADTGNHVVRAMDLTSRAVTTYAGVMSTAGTTDAANRAVINLRSPSRLATDGTDLYILDTSNHRVMHVNITTGHTQTIAGSAVGAAGPTDAVGTAARFNAPRGIAFDPTNTYLYISDSGNHTIRRIAMAGKAVVTIAGSAGTQGNTLGDGLTAAKFYSPQGLSCDSNYLYIADTSNSSIKKYNTTTGEVSLLAGGASAPSWDIFTGKGTGAYVGYPTALAYFNRTSSAGEADLMVTSIAAGGVRKVGVTTGQTQHIAGNFARGDFEIRGMADGSLLSTEKSFYGITYLGGYVFATDPNNGVIYRLKPDGTDLTIVAGKFRELGTTDGTGSNARFGFITGMTTDGINLYVTEKLNHIIRKVTVPGYVVSTIAGKVDNPGLLDATGTAAEFYNPTSITYYDKYLYIADTSNHAIRRLSLSADSYGVVTTFAGSNASSGTGDGIGTAASFNGPACVQFVESKLYVCDENTNLVREIDIATQKVTTTFGAPDGDYLLEGIGTVSRFKQPIGLTSDGKYLYIGNSRGQIAQYNPATKKMVSFLGYSARQQPILTSQAIEEPLIKHRGMWFEPGVGFFLAGFSQIVLIK